MTAIVGILNKKGIAIAADSAITFLIAPQASIPIKSFVSLSLIYELDNAS